MRVELLLSPDCAYAAAARAMLRRCQQIAGLDLSITERVGDFPSPTVLVDGVDVMTGVSGTPAMQACRLHRPTETRILTALRPNNADSKTTT
jgi:hypothetical protein